MSSPPGLGKNLYNETLARGQMSSKIVRKCLLRIIETHPGPQETSMLIAQAALHLGIIDESLNELDGIGQAAKNWKKDQNQ